MKSMIVTDDISKRQICIQRGKKGNVKLYLNRVFYLNWRAVLSRKMGPT